MWRKMTASLGFVVWYNYNKGIPLFLFGETMNSKFQKIFIIFFVADILLVATPFAMANNEVSKTVKVNKNTESVKKSVNVKDDSEVVNKSVTVNKPTVVTKNASTKKPTTVKKSVTVDCQDCDAPKNVETTVKVVKPKSTVTEQVVKVSEPAPTLEIHENTEPIDQCYEEIGNSGVYALCGENVPMAIRPINGEDKKITLDNDETVSEDNDEFTEDTDDFNDEDELPETGKNIYWYFLPLMLTMIVGSILKFKKQPKYTLF